MIYEYQCKTCSKTCDIIKPAAEFNRQEFCPACKSEMARLFRPKIHLHNTQVHHPYYSIALGDVVKNPKDERTKASDRGMVEIGSEHPRKHLKIPRKSYDI